jgi:hypothetical protein
MSAGARHFREFFSSMNANLLIDKYIFGDFNFLSKITKKHLTNIELSDKFIKFFPLQKCVWFGADLTY